MWGPGSEPDSPYTSASAAILDGAVSICERHQQRCQGAFTRSGKVEAVKYFKTTLMLISGVVGSLLELVHELFYIA